MQPAIIDLKLSDFKEVSRTMETAANLIAELDAVADKLTGFIQPDEAISCAVERLRKLAGV